MTASQPRGDNRQSILASFLAAVACEEAKRWLLSVLEDRTPKGVAVPPNESPFDFLMAVVGQHGDRATVNALGEAAGDLLADLLRDYQPPRSSGFLRRLARLLLILQAAPAPPRIWRTLFYGYQAGDFTGRSPDGLDTRHLALLAIAASPPLSALPLDLVLNFFRYELREHPDYAPAAFAGLRRLSPSEAVKHASDFLDALSAASPPIQPHAPLWEVFVDLEDIEQAVAPGSLSPAEELGRVLRTRPDLVTMVNRTIVQDLEAVEDFPTAWSAFQHGIAAEPRPQQYGFVFTPRALDPAAAQRLRAVANRLDGALLGPRFAA